MTNEQLPDDLVKIGREIYDLNKKTYILCSKTKTMVSPDKDVYFISFSEGDYNTLMETRLNIRENEEEQVYQKVKAYLKNHPQKAVGFDGCCLHPPLQL